MKIKKNCPKCGHKWKEFRNPTPTVDIIIEIVAENKQEGIVLIKRKNPPYGWAILGGYVDYEESLEKAACREASEETGLKVKLIRQFHAYSDPARSRSQGQHNITTVYIASAEGTPKPDDDAEDANIFFENNLPSPIVFDHEEILEDYFAEKRRLKPLRERNERKWA